LTITAINPATGRTIKEYQEATANDVVAAIEAADTAFFEWRETSFAHRSTRTLMRSAARNLRGRAERYARLMAQEMGKPLRDGEAEAEKCAWVCEYYAEHAEAFLQPERVETDASKSYVTFQPIGVVLAVMPWNFPFWQVFRFAAPALMAGNAGLLKHASNVPGCALAIRIRSCAPQRSPAVHLPVGRWQARLDGFSRRRCWSLAAAIPTSSWKTPISRTRWRRVSRAGSSIPDRAASPPSASWWSSHD
jgi:acyl-CoA reductase-like NAD-dependent aldehyde dehydrogenase